ncbi:MAG: radical SAM protein [Spirochaetaceae bacterium]|jgi:MoaA/NifB/PqqE/SkfB family radical SAM enzyme|nr:radical SAM protein [Spirochaetaceae bacterium]
MAVKMFLKNIKWDITKQCFLACSFCINKKERENDFYKDIDTTDIYTILSKLNSIGVTHIQFLGGEPTHRKDFLDILTYIENNTSGIKVGINTNGFLLKKQYIEKLRKLSCIDLIVISIDGIKETHNKIRGGKVYDVVIDNLKNLCKNNPYKICVNTVITKQNIAELGYLITFLDDIGIDEWIGLELITEKDNKYIQEFTQDELFELVKCLGALQKNVNCQLIPKFSSPLIVDYINNKYGYNLKLPVRTCSAGFGYSYIDWKGFIYPCDRLTENEKTVKIYKEKHLEKINLSSTDISTLIQAPLFREFNYVYSVGLNNIYSECKNLCKFFKKECTPCTVVRLNKNDKQSAPASCKKIFFLEKERIQNELRDKLHETEIIILNKLVTYDIIENVMYLYNHEQTEVYKITDLYFFSILLTLQNKVEGITVKDLLVESIDFVSLHQSLYLFSIDTILAEFNNALTVLKKEGILLRE